MLYIYIYSILLPRKIYIIQILLHRKTKLKMLAFVSSTLEPIKEIKY